VFLFNEKEKRRRKIRDEEEETRKIGYKNKKILKYF